MFLFQNKLIRQNRIIPILNRNGVSFLGLAVVLSLSGLLFNIPFIYSISLNLIILTLFITKCLIEYFEVKNIASEITFKYHCPSVSYVDREASFNFEIGIPLAKQFSIRLIPITNIICRERQNEFTLTETLNIITHKYVPLYRGEITLKQFNLRFILPNFLCNWQLTLQPEIKISTKVLPNAFSTGLAKNSLYGVYSQMNRLVKNKGFEGREYNGSRKYAVGDNKKSIDWKRSAKLGTLIVKTYRPESHQNIFIAIDASRRLSLLADERIQLDYAIDSASSIIRSTCFQNDEVALLGFHSKIALQSNLKNSNTQIAELISKLTKLEISDVEPNYFLINDWLNRYRRRGLVVLITSFSSPTNVDAVKNAMLALPKKHLPLVIAMDNDKLQTLSHSKANNIEDAYIRSAAWEQMQSIESKVNQLKKHGIDVVYANYKNIASLAEKKYWELKLSGKL